MVLQSIAPLGETTQFIYQMVWPLSREHCLLFVDAAIAEIAQRDGAVCDIFLRKDDESENESLLSSFAETRDIFATVADTEFKYISLSLMDKQTNSQLFIELSVDSNVCAVQILLFNSDGEIDVDADAEGYAPDLFMDAVEILTHVAYTVNNMEE